MTRVELKAAAINRFDLFITILNLLFPKLHIAVFSISVILNSWKRMALQKKSAFMFFAPSLPVPMDPLKRIAACTCNCKF